VDEGGMRAGTLSLLGGRPGLDFANTADWHASDNPIETLTSYCELVTWSVHAGILTDPQIQRILRAAARRPVDATAVLNRAIALREAIYRVFSALTHGHESRAADLAVLNAELSTTLAQSRSVSTEAGLAWDWAGDEEALDRML
jgi:predicted RNA-binding Zn ribbon-like protein